MIQDDFTHPSRAALALFGLLSVTACAGPELQPWHEASLDEEFTASMEDEIVTFDDYLALEDRLFAEVAAEISADVGPGATINRFSAGSLSDPAQRDPNWNRSQELPVAAPRGAVLLLHGLTDAPYTMRSLAESFNAAGYHALVLRLPGHGTAPASLQSFKWEDVAAAVRMALRHLGRTVGDVPVHVVGYSFGAPLAVNAALDAIEQDDLTVPSSLVLVSPAIGVTGAAAFAGAVDRIVSVPGLRSRRWSRVVPEYDPYKYNSFNYNAGAQVYEISGRVADRIEKRAKALDAQEPVLPPVLVLQSTLDTTVTAQAIIDRLLEPLRPNRHELVLFDLNRSAAIADLLVSDPGPFTARTVARDDLPFTFSLVTNVDAASPEVEVRTKPPMSSGVADTVPLGASWPFGMFSLSHIALPFPPDDPLYGARRPDGSEELFLGNARLLGELGELVFPSSWLMRIRHNPFHDYLQGRALDWLESHGSAP